MGKKARAQEVERFHMDGGISDLSSRSHSGE